MPEGDILFVFRRTLNEYVLSQLFLTRHIDRTESIISDFISAVVVPVN